MRNNFHAIGAVTYGLSYGIKGVPLFLRLGWPVLLLTIAGLVAAGPDALQLVQSSGMGFNVSQECLDGIDFADPDAWEEILACMEAASENDAGPTGQGYLSTLFLTAAFVLFIPVYVDMVRQAAGRPIRGGFLPTFGSAEVKMIIAGIVLVATAIGIVIVGALPIIVFAIIDGGTDAIPGFVFVLLGLVCAGFLLWAFVRLSLYLPFVALTENFSILDGFRLSKGKFWKLFGTLLLFGIVLALIAGAIGIAGGALTFAATGLTPLLAIAYLLLRFYDQFANIGFYARIVSDLLVQLDSEEAEPEPATS